MTCLYPTQSDWLSYCNSLSISVLKKIITWKDGYDEMVQGESRVLGYMHAVLCLCRKYT